MDKIRSELREGENGEPEVWTNLGDLLTWLDSLPEKTDNRIAAAVTMEIREMLFNMVGDAELVQKGQTPSSALLVLREGPRSSRRTVSAVAVIVQGGLDGSGVCMGGACGRDA